ncbi:MAG: leucine-rich repeat protein [Ruminococcus sp.]
MKKFKKVISVIIAVVMVVSVFSALPLNANAVGNILRKAPTFVSGDYQYEVRDDGTAAIDEYLGSDKNVVIPDKIDGYAVSRIGYESFLDCTSIESVIIPDGVTYIGMDAFRNCTNLKSITIPDTVNEIGMLAFQDTAWLENQRDGVVYAGKVVYTCKGEMPVYTNLTLKSDTTGIADKAFAEQENLYRIVIPDSVSVIGFGAFDKCTNLISVNIPDGVSTIEGDVFRGCKSLENIDIPNSVKVIEYDAFQDCSSIKSLTIPYTVTTIRRFSVGYGYDYSVFKNVKYEDFTIKGFKGTAAEEYAEEFGFDFVALTDNDFGDVNGDGVISIADSTLIQKYAASLVEYTSIQLALADFNFDGTVNVNDATEIQRALVSGK